MAIEVYRDWKQTRFVPGKSAGESYIVTGCANPSAAAVAVGVNGQNVPPRNTGYYVDARLIAQAPSVSTLGLNVYSVAVAWVRASGGEREETDNPLDEPPETEIEIAETTEPTAIDPYNNAILNSAGDPFDPPPSVERGTLFVTYVRNESTYDLTKALAYQNRVNPDAFTIPDVGTVEPGQCKCLYITRDRSTRFAEYRRITYRFELREEGFRHLILDEGFNGWFNDSGTPRRGRFCNNKGQVFNTPTRLDGTGKPIDPAVMVIAAEGLVPSTPISRPGDLPTGVRVEAGTDAKFMKYFKYLERPFSALALT